MAVKRLLLAYDGSKNSERALDWGIDFAKQTGAEISIVGVYDLGLNNWLLDQGITNSNNAAFQEQGRKIISAAADKAIKAGVHANVSILEGDPAEVLIEFAQSEKMDMIVCGDKGRGGLSKLILGSVAQKLVTYSYKPVLVVK